MKALDRIREALSRGARPFELRFAKDAWDDPALAADVAAVHRSASSALERLVQTTALDGRTRTALVLGETGNGKTHVLARLRRAVTGRAVFASVTSPDPTSLLASIVEALSVDLRRPLSAEEPPAGSRPRGQVALLVDRLVTAFTTAALGADEQVAAPYLGPDALDDEPAIALRLLERRFAPTVASRVPGCPEALVRALLLERASGRGQLETALHETDPFVALRGLGALGERAGVPIVVSMDQNDAIDVRTLAGVVTRLHSIPGLVVVITFLRTAWDARRDSLIEPERQRIEENRLALAPPTLAEVLAFAEARLEALHAGLGEARLSRLSPLEVADFEAIAAKSSGRLLLRDWCRALEALLEERVQIAESPVGGTEGRGVALGEPESSAVRQRLRALEAEVRGRLPEGEPALREALALALRGAGHGEVSGPHESEATFDVLITTPRERIGLKVLDTERPSVLARRLELMLDDLDAGLAARALLVRTRAVPGSWTKCGELADELARRGGAIVVLNDDERASLHALARLERGAVARVASECPALQRLLARPTVGAST